MSRRRLLGKQPQVQPGAQRGRDNKARSAEEYQASGGLSTPAADSGETRGNRRLHTDTDISASAAGSVEAREALHAAAAMWDGRKTALPLL